MAENEYHAAFDRGTNPKWAALSLSVAMWMPCAYAD